MTLDADRVVELYGRHVSRGRAQLGRLFGDRVEVRASGAVVRTSLGEELLSCGGYGVFLLGHCHPRVVEAVAEQARTHPLATRMVLEPRQAEAAGALAATTPAGLDYVHFTGSGAEATETALKLARVHGFRRVVATRGGYHGKTLGALSASGRDFYREPFVPLLPDVEHVPFGDAAALEAALEGAPPACVVLEPVQAEAGVVIPPEGYLAAVAETCRRHGALLVLDEIQTGLGRVGAWWRCEREGVVPDVLLAGKTLSGGVVPIAAAVTREDVYAPMSADPYLHTSTFAGSPLACAAAIAAIEVIRDEGLVERAAVLGREIACSVRSTLRDAAPHAVTEVRHAGLLVGIEFADAASAGEFAIEMLRQRVIVSHSMNAQCVVRLTPPAVMTDREVEWLLEAVEATARSLARTVTAAV